MKATDIISLAASQIGTVEKPNNEVLYNTVYYGRRVNGSAYAWCCTFVWWLFYALGESKLFYDGGKTASCTTLMNHHKSKGEFVTGGYKPGDLALFSWSGNKSVAEHIGIIESASGSSVTTIEGNTSLSSNTNGGGVMRRVRNISLVIGAVRPAYEAQDKPVLKKGSKGELVRELQTRLNSLGFNCGTVDGDFGPKTDSAVRAFQKAAKIGVDGIVGPQTWAALESWSAKPSVPMIVSKDILPISQPGTGLDKIPNSTSGSFYGAFKDVAGKIYYAPVSICVAKGKTYRSVSCHYFEGYPESVIYRTQTGQLGIKRVSSTSELPALSWAVGGMGLLDFYDPPAEGFKKIGNLDFSDVLRKTNHVMLGVKGEKIYQVFCANMTAQEVNSKAKSMGLEMAIMLDGGHIAGINGDVKINTEITQYYVIQGI
jgi:hypothetical protein